MVAISCLAICALFFGDKTVDKLEMDLKLLQQSHQMEIDKANKKIESLKENLESKEVENKEISDIIRGKFPVDKL